MEREKERGSSRKRDGEMEKVAEMEGERKRYRDRE